MGYLNGLTVGTLYFTGYTGLLLVLSIYLQDGLGYPPLQAGLALMPFAVGSAVAARCSPAPCSCWPALAMAVRSLRAQRIAPGA